ncbi:MAG: undecaprenyldiphospho-muramoylpentapeptide beta-N-acetylglucosaminyltransferase [Parasporobacterium sp.]|mgnify:CR=1 FL=1|nr:undecaprenyldiphospho-muramoylpentapeptide beta-N-acetylglucosaminyltransferase [Parasporobacterium sp.]
MNKILLTGGGTAGHVTPNLALVPYLEKAGFSVEYMGSYDGIERKLVEAAKIPYTGISSGKLRRYIDVKNLTDPVRIIKGLHEARHYMRVNKPDIVFSKGGFVAVPVVIAAAERHIPVVIHESDLSPGLANKISIPRASRICYSFPETEKYLTRYKAIHTGLPVRDDLLNGDAEKGRAVCSFRDDKPVVLVIGGSLGSVVVNEAVRASLPELLKEYNVIHICGSGKTDEALKGTPGYVQFEYVSEELPHMFAAADIVISRAGANVINELAAIRKPAVLIPLGTNASRGDQLLNAESFERRGFSAVLREEALTPASLTKTIDEVFADRQKYADAMTAAGHSNACEAITDIIISTLQESRDIHR